MTNRHTRQNVNDVSGLLQQDRMMMQIKKHRTPLGVGATMVSMKLSVTKSFFQVNLPINTSNLLIDDATYSYIC